MMNISENTAAKDAERVPKSDSYTCWYTVSTGAFFLLVSVSTDIDRIFKLYVLLVPILVVPALILAATLVISLGVNVFRRRWRRSVSIVVAPIIAVLFFHLLGWLGLDREAIRLKLWKSSYLAEVDAIPATDGHLRLKSWDWGSTGGVAVPNIFWKLVYDESDQIALPRSSWSAEWLRNADQSGNGSVLYSILHPEGNYQRR
jgi:cytochrome c oxidase subunit IV